MLSENTIREFLKTIDNRFDFNPTPNDRICINTLIKNKKKEIAEFETKVSEYEKFKTDYDNMKKNVALNLHELLSKVIQGDTEDLQWDNVYHSNNKVMYSNSTDPEVVLAAKLADTLMVRLRKNKEFALKKSTISSFFNENPSEKLEKLKHELEALETVKRMLS